MTSPEPTQLTNGVRGQDLQEEKRVEEEGACLGEGILAGFLEAVAGRADGKQSHGGRSLQLKRCTRGRLVV